MVSDSDGEDAKLEVSSTPCSVSKRLRLDSASLAELPQGRVGQSARASSAASVCSMATQISGKLNQAQFLKVKDEVRKELKAEVENHRKKSSVMRQFKLVHSKLNEAQLGQLEKNPQTASKRATVP